MKRRSGHYELKVFAPGARGRYVQVKSMHAYMDDPHEVAVTVWRYGHCTTPYRCVVLDKAAGKGPLAPVITYEDLVRRAGSIVATGQP